MINIDESLKNMTVWILSDGKIGHLNQSVGVAEALGVEYDIIDLKETKYAKILGRISGNLAVKNKFSRPWPSMVIATGTLAGLVSGWIKQQNHETITVQMMKPPNKYYLYDVIASPLHDKMKNLNNVVYTVGSPNKINSKNLEKDKNKWKNNLGKMKIPLAVLIGGTNRYFTFTNEHAKKFAEDIVIFAEKNRFKSLFVTSSRRTGMEQVKIIQNILEKSNLAVHFWNGDGDNPYFAYLAYAKGIVVTADSVGMVSESCTTNLPVFVYGTENMKSSKFKIFFNNLFAKKYIKHFELQEVDLTKLKTTLSDTEIVVGAINSVVFKKSLSVD